MRTLRTYIRFMVNTRRNEDGFKGEYPKPSTAADELYRRYGLVPPWELEYEDGRVVDSEKSV